MLDHHIQKAIVYQLAFRDSARFSELQPDGIENKLFTYHLKKVMAAGYVTKGEDGLYALTAEGRRLGFQAVRQEQLLDRAYSVLLLIVRREADGAWLLYRRSTHPLRGYTVLPQATPVADKTAAETAQLELRAKTGLECAFTARGSGYLHVYSDDEIESYTNFTLLVCEEAKGELVQSDANGTYEWVVSPDFTHDNVFPSLPFLVAAYETGEPFFLEESFTI